MSAAIGGFPGQGGIRGTEILVWDKTMLPAIFSCSRAGTVTSDEVENAAAVNGNGCLGSYRGTGLRHHIVLF